MGREFGNDGWMQPRKRSLAFVSAAVVFGFVALTLGAVERDTDFVVGAYLLIGLASASLALPRGFGYIALGVVVSRVVLAWWIGDMIALVPATWIGLYLLASSGERRRSLLVATAVAVATALVVAALDEDPFLVELVGEMALMLLPIAIADAVRSREDKVRTLVDAEATSRVQAERLRIARDLHDVVAHGLSIISVQSGVASYLIDQNPNEARQALDIINDAGKKSLEDLRSMVGVLRSTDDAPLGPTPTDPNDLQVLLVGARHSGTPVDMFVDGVFPDDASDACVVAVHRILQEALTNVARHANGATTTISIGHAIDQVDLRVLNESGVDGEGDVKRVPSTGVGIIGMTERANALGGTLRAGPVGDGGFEVVAELPYNRRASQ